MDINQSLAGLVDSLGKQILAEVSSRVDANIQSSIESRLDSLDVATRFDVVVADQARQAAAAYQPDFKSIDKQLEASASVIINNVSTTVDKLVRDAVNSKMAAIDFQNVIMANVSKLLDQKLQEFNFPAASIPADAIDFADPLSGDNVRGGVIREFASTGIDDKSTGIQVTVLDEYTVVENQLLAQDFTVKGRVNLDGEVALNGSIVVTSPGFVSVVRAASEQVKTELNDDLFASFGRIVFDQIRENGIDLNKLTLNGEDIVINRTLGSGITDSNLQKVGVLRELQVSGETLLVNTLYATDRRVGINTLEPNSALTIWDDEIEINIGKRQQGVAVIGTARNQSIMLSTNNKSNLLLNADGSVTAQRLNMGNMSFATSPSAPNFDAAKGTVLFNENPSLGGPLGWVSLGNARWANFGIIE